MLVGRCQSRWWILKTTPKKDRYKEKRCPVCSKLHHKRWPCCSAQCGLVFRTRTPPTPEAIAARAEGVRRWKQTDVGEATNSNLVTVIGDEDLILPPVQHDGALFVEDGDVWSPDI